MFPVPVWSWYPIFGQKIYFLHGYQTAALKCGGSFHGYRTPLLQTKCPVGQQHSWHRQIHTKGTPKPGKPRHKGAPAPSDTGASALSEPQAALPTMPPSVALGVISIMEACYSHTATGHKYNLPAWCNLQQSK